MNTLLKLIAFKFFHRHRWIDLPTQTWTRVYTDLDITEKGPIIMQKCKGCGEIQHYFVGKNP